MIRHFKTRDVFQTLASREKIEGSVDSDAGFVKPRN